MLFYLFHSVIFVILQRHLKDIDLVFIRLLPVVWVCISITGLLMNHLEEVALMFPPSMVHYVYICFGSFLLENSLPMSHNRYWYVLWTRFFPYIIARTETPGRSLSVSIISDRPPEHDMKESPRMASTSYMASIDGVHGERVALLVWRNRTSWRTDVSWNSPAYRLGYNPPLRRHFIVIMVSRFTDSVQLCYFISVEFTFDTPNVCLLY